MTAKLTDLLMSNYYSATGERLADSVIRSGLHAYYDGASFKNSPPSSAWADESGNGFNLPASNFSYTALSGSDGDGGVMFDGANDYCLGSVTGLTGNVAATLCFRAKLLSNASGDAVMVFYGKNATAYQCMGLYASTSSSYFKFTTWSGSGGDYNTGFAKDYSWHSWAIVYDGTNVLVYRDGVSDPGGSKAKSINFTTPCQMVLGDGNAGGNSANVVIKKAALYNRALSAAEVLENSNLMAA